MEIVIGPACAACRAPSTYVPPIDSAMSRRPSCTSNVSFPDPFTITRSTVPRYVIPVNRMLNERPCTLVLSNMSPSEPESRFAGIVCGIEYDSAARASLPSRMPNACGISTAGTNGILIAATGDTLTGLSSVGFLPGASIHAITASLP